MRYTMEKYGFNLHAHLKQLFAIGFAFLTVIQAVSSSCDYNPSEIKFETLRLSVGLPSNFTELRFRAFIGISLAGCEKECGLRRQCSMYSYHRIMHLCELFDLELDVNELKSWVTRHAQSVVRKMDSLTRQEILTDCGAIDCPVGSVCSCGQPLYQRCEIAECPKPKEPDNVIILGNRYGVGNRISGVCAPGYAPASDVGVSRVCQKDGQWSGIDPVCVPACGPLTPPDNGNLAVSVRNVFPSVAQFSCDGGYTVVGSSVLMCTQDGSWNDTSPTCIQDNLLGIDCGDPSAPGNGTVTASTTTVGSTAVYACLDGFQLMGAASVECSSTGDWSDYPPKCMLITCPPLESPSNGSVSISDGTAAGSNATFFCEVGYELLGEATLQCLDTGSWTSPPPQCVLKNCGPIEAPMNGSVSFPDGTTVGAIATFTCEIGFQLLGEDSVQCLEDGSWSDSAPTCEIRDCGYPPKLPDGSVSAESTTYGSNTTFTCGTGYDLRGSSYITCLSNGSWSWFDAYCQRQAMMFQRCTSNSDCWETDSECRDQTCGCLMGLSYQPGEDACVDSLVGGCLAYGNTFQVFQQNYLLGADNISYYGYTQDQCKYACIELENCISADYWTENKACHLSQKSSATNPDLMRRESDDSFVYLHRDCACAGPEEECYGCGFRPAIAEASLVNMILPVGAFLGTETGVTLTYLCDFWHHMRGATTIESVCGEDGTWTNLNAGCSYESYKQPCTDNSHCLEPNSECRDLICVCRIGYSYSQTDFSCVQDCPEFGSTFQTVDSHYFKPDPAVHFTSTLDTDSEECKRNCLSAMNLGELPVECKSANYNEDLRECFIFSESASAMPENLIADLAGSHNTYLHRDCICPRSSALCSGCDDRRSVPEATLTKVYLPEGAEWGTEVGVVHIYKCREGFDYEGNTEIDSTCEEGSGWTNLDAECIGDTIQHNCTEYWDCVGTGSECRATEDPNTKKCGCILGSGYFPAQHACIEAVCSTYGSTFQVYPSTRLLGDKELVLDGRTHDECQEACISPVTPGDSFGGTCASFNFNYATGQCELSLTSAVGQPTLTEMIATSRSVCTWMGDPSLSRGDCVGRAHAVYVPNRALSRLQNPCPGLPHKSEHPNTTVASS